MTRFYASSGQKAGSDAAPSSVKRRKCHNSSCERRRLAAKGRAFPASLTLSQAGGCPRRRADAKHTGKIAPDLRSAFGAKAHRPAGRLAGFGQTTQAVIQRHAARELDCASLGGVRYGMAGSRISDLQNFYGLLGSLAERVGGARKLAACSGRTWMAAARCLLLHGRRGGPVGQRQRPPHRARRHTCADGRLRDETLETALAASRSAEVRRR